MKKNLISIVLICSVSCVSCAADKTLCENDEFVWFNCEITKSKKILSICGSKIIGKNSGYLQYRYGDYKNIELAYPKERKNRLDEFDWESHRPYRGFYDALSFWNGDHQYTVYISEDEDARPSYGVIVTKIGTADTVAELSCKKHPSGPFLSLGKIIPHEDN